MNVPRNRAIQKAHWVRGKTLVFRNAEVTDTDFILSLRTDSNKSRYLSQTTPEFSQQVAWLTDYAGKTDQAYFIIETKDSVPLGTIRLYDAHSDSFCWGSWILKDGAPRSAAIESALMVYSYAIDHLGFRAAHFDVRRGNENVWRFHERFGAERVGETTNDYLYQISIQKVLAARLKYKKYLPEIVTVEW
ncbi:MAG: GNAT family N-acetyltransferase [Thermodesulfobacteriota bacterium]